MRSRGTASRRGYLISGVLYLVSALPALGLLIAGKLLGMRNGYLLLSMMGIPLGVLLLIFGTGRVTPNSRSEIGVRMGYIGIAFLVFLLGSLIGVRLGVEPLMTSVVFCAMASSYIAIVTMVFLIAAIAGRERR